MPRVADYIYHMPKKQLHPFYVQIGVDKTKTPYFHRVFATLEEAIKYRDQVLKCQ